MINTSENLGEISPALVEFQKVVTDPKKDTSGYGYKYATLDQVLAIARPALTDNGLSVSQHLTSSLEGQILSVTTRLQHASGEFMESTISLRFEDAKGMSRAQSVGSASTYMRRYAMQAVLGITAEEDDDAPAKKVNSNTHEDVDEDFL